MAYPNYIWVKIQIPPEAHLDELVVDRMLRDFELEAKDVAIDRTFNVDEDLVTTLNKHGDEMYRDYGPKKGLVPFINGKATIMTLTWEDPSDFKNLIEAIAGKYDCKLFDWDVAVCDCDTYWVDDGFPPCR